MLVVVVVVVVGMGVMKLGLELVCFVFWFNCLHVALD